MPKLPFPRFTTGLGHMPEYCMSWHGCGTRVNADTFYFVPHSLLTLTLFKLTLH